LPPVFQDDVHQTVDEGHIRSEILLKV
jgi:hypothetical protein